MGLKPVDIRNVMLGGHSSSGKTSLAEALMHLTKSSDRFGSVVDGNTVSDFDPEEIKRGSSISSSLLQYQHSGKKINLLDAPGIFDFELGLYESVMAADSVLIVVSARAGVAVGTEKANRIAYKNKKSRMFFINQMTVENADYGKVLASLRDNFGTSVCPIVVPVVEEGKATVYVDLLTMKAYEYANGKAKEVDLPDADLEEYIHELNEAVAETDEELMEKFFSDEPFTGEELIKGLSIGIADGSVAPVLAGDAVELEGIDLLLSAISDLLPSPLKASKVPAVDAKDEEIEIAIDPSGKLCCYVFKTIVDPFVGKLSFVKVLSGKLGSNSPLYNNNKHENEKIGKLLSIKGKKQTEVDEIVAGDIGAITKLSDTGTGDTLSDPSFKVKVKSIDFPTPSLSIAIAPKKKGDESKISGAIQRITDEDQTLSYFVNSETGQQILSGLGEQHLDVVLSRMKSKFGVEVDTSVPRIAYRETIRKKVKVQGRHKKQSGGHGQFGDVWIEFEPNEGDELVFEEKIFGGAVPKNFFPAVEKGLIESTEKGVLAGYPVVGIKATLVDGSYHSVDSSEMAFKTAASIAFKEGVSQASPILLEPILSVKALVPDSNTGDIMGEVTKRRGRVLGMHPGEDSLQQVEAEVPESEMSDFTTYIRSSTQGRGSFTTEFLRYEPLPSTLEQKVIDEAERLKEENQ
ncbi:MAG: elongation factor G [Ruminococcaceae bacterium]|nr:elongation factor G [Oscillospiraceae bacterium]